MKKIQMIEYPDTAGGKLAYQLHRFWNWLAERL